MIALCAAAGTASAQERTRGDFDADGVRIHYGMIGDGPPVVLLHGFGASMSGSPMAKTSLEGVAGHRLIGMNVRGFGMSGRPDGPESYGIETARDVIRLLDPLESDRPVCSASRRGHHRTEDGPRCFLTVSAA